MPRRLKNTRGGRGGWENNNYIVRNVISEKPFEWSLSGGAVSSFSLRWGSSPENLQYRKDGIIGTSIAMYGLNTSSTYYWQVIGVNGSSTIFGNIQSFTTAPVFTYYLPFNENSGTVTRDSTLGTTATLYGGARFSTFCPEGSCLNFTSSTTAYASIPTTSTLIGFRDITLQAWVFRRAVSPRTHVRVVSKDYDYFLGFSGAGSNRLAVDSGGGGGWQGLTTATRDLPLGRWVHIAYTYSSSTNRLYYDGELVEEQAKTRTFGPGTQPLTISGPTFAFNDPFDGLVDEVKISPFAKTGAEIRAEVLTKTPPMP